MSPVRPLVICAVLPVTFLAGYIVGDGSASVSADTVKEAPLATSIEAAFARDMWVHHSQAVDMAERMRARTMDPNLRALTTDIVLTQQSQIGQFWGWLEQWRLPISSGEGLRFSESTTAPSSTLTFTAPNREEAEQPTGHNEHADRTMPGMATRANINRITTATLMESERTFLQLMIAHHQGGVVMSRHVLERTKRREVIRLAKSIIVGQTGEIRTMRRLLAAREALR